MEKKNLELYIHIPFCIRKCAYCDFLSFASNAEERKAYIEALLVEIEQYRSIGTCSAVSSIFIGGGTPSVLEVELMSLVLEKVKEIFQIGEAAEISIEVNPGTMTLEKAQAYKRMGINRVSIGLQATNDEELQMLGRIHSYSEFLETYERVKDAGIHNINVDLISAIPKQTVESWTETLDRVIALQPTHISAYSLIIEEGTKFYENLNQYEALLPSEDAEREMYHLTKARLKEAGYERYEISNYAKQGYECKHNLGYWERENYLGIGLGSASLIDNVRYANERDMEAYIGKCLHPIDSRCILEEVRGEKEIISREAQMEEFMFLGLRKTKGVSLEDFEEYFGVEIYDIYGEVFESLIERGLIHTLDKGRVQLTDLGMDISNQVMVEFLL